MQCDREYIRTGTSYHQSEKGVANCDHSRTCPPNLVNFGPQTAKNRTGVSTHSKSTFLDAHISGAKGRLVRPTMTTLRPYWDHSATLLRSSTIWSKIGCSTVAVRSQPRCDRGIKLSLIGKRRCKLRSLPYMPTKFGELWSANGEMAIKNRCEQQSQRRTAQ